jgi:hypothetical protein
MFILPAVIPVTVHPPQERTSAVVLFIVVVFVAQVRVPLIVQLPTRVFVLLPENETGPGNVCPLLVMVEAADIVIDPVPDTVQECCVRSVKAPPIVNTTAVLIVTEEVKPVVNVNDRIVILAETIDASFP